MATRRIRGRARQAFEIERAAVELLLKQFSEEEIEEMRAEEELGFQVPTAVQIQIDQALEDASEGRAVPEVILEFLDVLFDQASRRLIDWRVVEREFEERR